MSEAASITSILALLVGLLTFPASAEDRTIDVEGTAREYVIDVPSSYDGSAPFGLVLCFHGLGGSASSTRTYARFWESGTADRFITVYPQGLLIPNPLSAGDSATGWVFATADNRDVPFVEAILDSLETEFVIDTGAVFVTGISNGGFFSDILGCTIGDRLTAIAPVVGGYPLLVGCSVTKPLAVFRLGTVEDELVSIDYLRNATAFWVEHNGCSDTPTQDGMCDEYDGCNGGVSVVHCEYTCVKTQLQPNCHTWPLPPAYEFSTTDKILEFFRACGLGQSHASVSRPRFGPPASQELRAVLLPDRVLSLSPVAPGAAVAFFSVRGQRVRPIVVEQDSGVLVDGLSAGTYLCIVAGALPAAKVCVPR